MKESNQTQEGKFKLSFPERPMQHSMVQLNSHTISFSPRTKLGFS